MTKFFVETISTFREVHIVEAENEEIAQKIAANSDYNMSKWLGQQVATIFEYNEQDLERYKREDQYFWMGIKGIDEEGYLTYLRPGGEPIRSDMNEKIV